MTQMNDQDGLGGKISEDDKRPQHYQRDNRVNNAEGLEEKLAGAFNILIPDVDTFFTPDPTEVQSVVNPITSKVPAAYDWPS